MNVLGSPSKEQIIDMKGR